MALGVALAVVLVCGVSAGVSAPPKDLPKHAKKMPKHIKNRLACSICETTVEEVEGVLSTEKHKVQVSWRMDDKKYVEQARSEARVTELLEDMPDRFADYGVREETGSDGKKYDKLVAFKKKSGSSGGMTISGGVSISAGKQDEMRAVYEWMAENHLDDMVNFFRKHTNTPIVQLKKTLCIDFFKSCADGFFDPKPETDKKDDKKDDKKEEKNEEKKDEPAAAAAAAADPKGEL